MSSQERLQRKLDNVPEKEKANREEEFGPIRTKKETEEDRAKLIELARKSLDL